ncbi:solute carrier family 43 member 3 isoform X2 [Sceloporus undulatus]|nr:solute carrier family 43 member 3 isoform X2 [Sceloporus undulatus]XP_042305076.1 solute carrier family 43 member 3 isoform X2 [Sceloporus undulatus]XP_042305085.1 solute carrier family 43 member 3 isoform X2 [Sceloporus undulatus]XP_042305095.1 solute carrier family 43 member 3 isoform X2 [Sceloporus undulatus]XP_042305106.1 solute carrier family 43 member 3 isoform X2 [Sceloporus undulatus]
MEHRGSGMAKRLATFISGLVECMCFAGVIFGWASLVFVLKDLGYFQDLCVSVANQTANQTDCSAQDEQLSLIFTIGSFMNNFMTFPTGYIFDRFGTTVARLLAISSYTTGTLLIAFSTAATAVMLFPALSFLSIGGILLILTNMQVGNLFGKHRSTVITLYNGAFDSSSAVFLVIKLLYEQGLSLRTMFLFMSTCSAWHIVRTFFLMPRHHIPYPLPPGYTYGLSCQRRSQSYRTYEEKRCSRSLDDDEAQDSRNLHPDSALSEEHATPKVTASKGHTETTSDFKEPAAVSFWSCVFSQLFFWHMIWLSVMQLRHYLFIGTLNPMLIQLADKNASLVSHYTNAFAFTQLCGVLCAPWNGLILDRHKRGQKKEGCSQEVPDSLADLRSCVLSLVITVLQCIAFSVCASIPVLPVQYATFILQVLSRSFLYGGNAAFLAIAFPLEHFGKLYGLIMGLSAVVSLLQYPFFSLIKGLLKEDPFYVNIGLIVLMLLALINPFMVWRECRRRQEERDAAHSTTTPALTAEKPGLESSI